MNTKIFSLLIIVWTITCIEICTGCKYESPEEITITPSTNNSIQTLLSEEVLALLDAQQIQQLPSFKFNARYKEHPEIQRRIEMSLIPETLSNSFTAYLQLFDKFSHISTNDLCSYLAAEMDALTSDIYTPITSWETDKLLRFRRAQKLFHFVDDFRDPNFLGMIPHFEKHLTTNGSLYLAIGGLLLTGTNGVDILCKALDNESLGIQSTVLQAFDILYFSNGPTGMYTEEQLEILFEKATQYLKNPPANPFSPEDPHWIQNEIWIRAARCASLDLVIDRLFFVGDPIELWNLIQELALDDSDPIIRMAALKQIESLKRLAYEQYKEKILISPDTVLNEIRTARDEEYPFVRYLAQQVSLSRSYKNWRYLNLENPLEYSLYYYQFPGEQIITPKTHQTYQR